MSFLIFPGLILAASTAGAQLRPALPDAPQPSVALGQAQSGSQRQLQPTPPGKPGVQSAGAVDHASYAKRKWAQYVDPGERVPRLSTHDKMVFWLHEESQPWSAAPALLSAGWGQLTGGAPDYGSDSAAFGERLGAALLRQASFRFFSSSLFPAVDGEDPRYYRKAEGSIRGRAVWAAERVLITQRDSGDHSVNFSLMVGHLAASELTRAWYPRASANEGMALETWGTSLAGAAGNNMFLEFWPDVINRWRHHRERKHTASSPQA